MTEEQNIRLSEYQRIRGSERRTNAKRCNGVSEKRRGKRVRRGQMTEYQIIRLSENQRSERTSKSGKTKHATL